MKLGWDCWGREKVSPLGLRLEYCVGGKFGHVGLRVCEGVASSIPCCKKLFQCGIFHTNAGCINVFKLVCT
jgi:hypothetical protein